MKPISPAGPNSSAYPDHNVAASVPTEIKVSMVALACSRFSTAARWNGQPAQSTTGSVRAKEIHCHQGNCSAGTIAKMITGRLSTAEMISRRRRSRRSSSVFRGRSVGSVAPYPVCSMVAINACGLVPAPNCTEAFSVA